MNPRLGEVILDPACGTSGFLVESFKPARSPTQSIFGGEAKPLPYLLAQMNLVLHGLESPKIDPLNSLRFPLREIGDRDRVDVIMTNPLFGGEEERGIRIPVGDKYNYFGLSRKIWLCQILNGSARDMGIAIIGLRYGHVRRFWFGFYSPNKKEIDRLIVRAPLFLRPGRRQVFRADIEKTRANNWRFRKPLSKSEFGRTFHEQYDDSSHYYFGIFDREAITSRRKLRLLTKRAAVFVTDVVRNLLQRSRRIATMWFTRALRTGKLFANMSFVSATARYLRNVRFVISTVVGFVA